MEERILVLAPFGRDSAIVSQILHEASIEAHVCASIGALCDEMPRGVGGLLVTEEALTEQTLTQLMAALADQPPWSDIPMVMLVSGGLATRHVERALIGLGAKTNVTYVERPVRATTLLSAVGSMLRARRRQYETRDLIDAYAAAEASERAARTEAENATAMRDEFLGVASHELRTPLTVVMGYAETLVRRARRGTLDPDSIVPFLEELYTHAQRLDALVEDLLDTSRIQQGRIMLEPTRVNLNDLARAVVDRFQRNSEFAADHVLSIEAAQEIVGLWDESRLDQVLTNLVSNALKYSPDGGRVTVTLEQRGERATICVSDEGLGIPEERLPELFQPFSRLHRDRRIVNGTGLGLYISAQLVERHGGTIRVNTRLDEGSTFIVDLPLRVIVEDAHDEPDLIGGSEDPPGLDVAV